MNIELFIARKLIYGNRTSHFAAPIIRIAQFGIAAGICVMLLSIFITSGFKKEITDKVVGFSSHIEAVPQKASRAWSESGAGLSENAIRKIISSPGICKAEPYINKPGILKTGFNFNGVVMHGISSGSDSSFFHSYLKEGKFFTLDSAHLSYDIVLSKNIAARLHLKTGDRVIGHFIQSPPRSRPFKVAGIYETGFNEYDDAFVICDMRVLQHLNRWEDHIYSGLAINVNRLEDIHTIAEGLDSITDGELSDSGWSVRTMYEKVPDLFDWLSLLDMNVTVILILLVLVAGFNMISSLIIIIVEKARFIGIMKSLGMRNIRLKKIFLWISAFLVGEGMLWGNIAAFLFSVLQKEFHIITLDSSTYYMEWVPIHIESAIAVLLNIGVILATIAMLVIPTVIISRMDPVKVIKFD